MSVPTLLRPVDFYAQLTAELAAKGWIDPPGDLARSRVYLFTGQADKIVSPKTIELGATLYHTLGVPASHVKFRDRDLPGAGAGHSWVTKNFGNSCDANAKPFINDCRYDQAEELLQTMYGALEPPAGRPGISSPSTRRSSRRARRRRLTDCWTRATSTCRRPASRSRTRCRSLWCCTGCLQSAEVLRDEFYTKIGVNEWADTNRIVVLYPQAHATTIAELTSQDSSSVQHQPGGCWNWWGYAGDKHFLTKQGVQVGAIWSMVQRVTGPRELIATGRVPSQQEPNHPTPRVAPDAGGCATVDTNSSWPADPNCSTDNRWPSTDPGRRPCQLRCPLSRPGMDDEGCVGHYLITSQHYHAVHATCARRRSAQEIGLFQ
jgi:hypothetical protein